MIPILTPGIYSLTILLAPFVANVDIPLTDANGISVGMTTFSDCDAVILCTVTYILRLWACTLGEQIYCDRRTF